MLTYQDVNVGGAGDDAKILIKVKCGHVDLRSWLEVQGDKIVGMGSATEYDENGRIVSHKVEPTGLVARYEQRHQLEDIGADSGG